MALVSLIRLPPSLHRVPDLCHSAVTRITRNSLFYNLGQGGGEEGEDGFVMCCLEENKLRKISVEGGVPPVRETFSPLKHSLALVRACTGSNAIRNEDLFGVFSPFSAGSFLKVVFLSSNHTYVYLILCEK